MQAEMVSTPSIHSLHVLSLSVLLRSIVFTLLHRTDGGTHAEMTLFDDVLLLVAHSLPLTL